MGPRQDPRSFFLYFFWCVRDPPPLFLFTPLFIVVFVLLNGVPRYLSHQPLPPVVGSGCKDSEVLLCQAQGTECNNGSLPLDASILSVVFLCFRAFPALWNDLESRYRWSIISFTLGYIHPRRIFPWPRRGFFMGWALGPI